MRKSILVTAVLLVSIIACAPAAWPQTQTLEGYTFIKGASGTQVCLGRWTPPADIALPGECEGQIIDVAQLTAVSARLTADRLDQLLLVLSSIDEKMDLNNDQVGRLIDATVSTQDSIDEQVHQVSNLLREAINRRFGELSEEVLANDVFRSEIEKLKKDILEEVERHYPPSSKPATK